KNFNVRKLDLYTDQSRNDEILPLLEEAARLGCRLSMRCRDTNAPDGLVELAEAGLLDLALDIPIPDPTRLLAWVDAASHAALPLRLYLDASGLSDGPTEKLLKLMGRAATVEIALTSPFEAPGTPRQLPPEQMDYIV